MAVSFDQNFDVELEQPPKRGDPRTAVHIRIRSREISPHETVSRKQDLLLRVVQTDVVMTVPWSRERLQVAHTPADHAIWLLQLRARSNHELADPGKTRGDRQAFCRRFADVERGPGSFCQPVEIAGMFFVVMGGDYRMDSVRRQSLEMAQESAAETGRSRVNRYR